jgi:PDZ domain
VADDAARTRVAERLEALQSTNQRLGRVLEAVADGASRIPGSAIEREPVDGLTNAIAAFHEPLPPRLKALSAAAERAAQRVPRSAGDGPVASAPKASEAIEAAYIAVGEASGVAASLFTTGRLMFEGAACDLAVNHMKTYAQVTKALNLLLPQVVGWELREEGLACHCICPMCGLGACGCIWASLHNIDVAWGGAGLAEPDERGIPLRSPPRSGSQLAAAGVQQWDRIVSVDDEPVRSLGELQAALRRHGIGEEVRLRIDLDDESREIVVRHASDLP